MTFYFSKHKSYLAFHSDRMVYVATGSLFHCSDSIRAKLMTYIIINAKHISITFFIYKCGMLGNQARDHFFKIRDHFTEIC